MPVASYDYRYSRYNKNTRDLARNAKSNFATKTMSAQKKVSRNIYVNSPVVVKKKIEIEKPKEMKLTKPVEKVDSKAKIEKAKKSILATVAIFGMLFMICTRYAQINELTHKMGALEKDLANVESLNQQLSAQVDSKTDLNYIEKYAKYQLGMQKPDEKQIVRIAYDKQDRISTPIDIEEENEQGFFEKIFNDLKNLVD